MPSKIPTVGLAGCGVLGRRLGSRLLHAGHRLTVYDRDVSQARPLIDAGAAPSRDLEHFGSSCDVLVSALPYPGDVESVFLGEHGAWAAASPRTLHFETSTIGTEAIERVAREARKRGIWFLDCPISRGPSGRDGPELTLWAGGHADHFYEARGLLHVLAENVHYCGRVGHGQVTKLINNLIAHSLAVVVGEALVLGVRSGIPLEVLATALPHGTSQNRVLDELLPESVFRDDWKPGLRLSLAVKDLELASELAGEKEIRLTALDRFLGLYRDADRKGWSDLTSLAVVRLIEEAAGVTLRSHAPDENSDS